MSIICGLVIVSYFNAILPYRLAVEALTKAPFSTVKDFLQSDFTIYSYFSVKESFLKASSPHYQQLGARIQPLSNAVNHPEFMARPNSEREAFIAYTESQIVLTDYTCDFVQAVPNVQGFSNGIFWFRKGSPYYLTFALRFLRLANQGVLYNDIKYFDQYIRDHLTDQNKTYGCVPHPLSTKLQLPLVRRGLSVQDLALPFNAILAVSASAVLFMFGELLYYKWSCRRIVPAHSSTEED
ncbi:hypothetical protein RvY_03497-1 [Ramazzottius varieornatus]|uniref:Ionotropic glutamate receptor C-terminal domain-containing protein n=1 Tax=Ramazzottius varieornatus TaxID=947166 RepID=A0A1D1UP22_RAMVA|nr:hypothetical protein RvY_03497-1 [Ramazzottius varieornatus]